MENKLEQLLNSLIEKGWRPFGREKKELKFVEIWKEMLLEWEENYYCSKWYSYRELVSKESWLWQFVCENGIVDMEYKRPANYTYRIIESALKDESELEEFLLSNIKVDG